MLQEITFDLYDKKINFIYPSTNPTGHDAKWFCQGRDVIHIEELELDSGQGADGEGDTIAHEFAHSIMNMYYGDYDWRSFYDDDTYDAVTEKCKTDIEYFGWKFD